MCGRGRSRRGLDTPCPGRAIYIEPGGVFPENLSLFGGTVARKHHAHLRRTQAQNIEREATTTQQRERALLTILDGTLTISVQDSGDFQHEMSGITWY